MAYSSGTSTGPADLLDKLRLFLIANGWTVNKWDDDDTRYPTPSGAGLDGDGKRLHVQKTAADSTVMYFNLRSTVRGIPFGDRGTSGTLYAGKFRAEVTGLCLYGSTGYDGGLVWDLQPGGTLNGALSWGVCMTELSTSAIPAYYFFEDGDTVIVLVEYTAGKYQWFTFGCLEKQGTYTGGQFFSGSLGTYEPSFKYLSAPTDQTMFLTTNYDSVGPGNGAVYLNVDSTAGWRASGYLGGSGSGTGYKSIIFSGVRGNDGTKTSTNVANNSLVGLFFSRSPNFYNGLAPFAASYVLGKRSSGNFSLLGWPKNIRHISVTNYNPAQEITLASDTWMIFPEHSKADADPAVGFAVKKVV
jgi:hypothetical protein